MDIFWRDVSPEAARNSLNVAICGLRKSLKFNRSDFDHILFEDDQYLLNPSMKMWIDVEEFMQHYETGHVLERKGKLIDAIREYEIADDLYHGDFLKDDLYEDWTILRRDSLKENYLVILDRLSRYYLDQQRYTHSIHFCQKILAEDNWREDAHRRLMLCYSRLGQRNLALRQYDFCAQALTEELEVSPMRETVDLFNRIRREENV